MDQPLGIDSSRISDKKRRYDRGRGRTAKGGRAIKARLRGRKQDTAEAAPRLYVEAKYLEKVNKTVHEPTFMLLARIFYGSEGGL